MKADGSVDLEELVDFAGNDGGLEVDNKILGITANSEKPRSQVGSGGAGKLNALQIMEVKGQIITDTNEHHVYFTTQDNSIWASKDSGKSWPREVTSEGFGLDIKRRVAKETDSRVTVTTCGWCQSKIFDAQLANGRDWKDPFPDSSGNDRDHGYPILLNNGARISNDVDKKSVNTIKWTEKPEGGDWNLLVTVNSAAVRDSFHLSGNRFYFQINGPNVSVPFYFGAADITRRTLARVDWPATSNNLDKVSATITYPAMRYKPVVNGITGLSRMNTSFANYGIFDVDPKAPSHLIAPDNFNRVMVHSYDAGGSWSPLLRLSELVIHSGRYSFVDEHHKGPTYRWHWPLASAVSFYPEDPNLVIVGARQGGVYASADRGINWIRIAGSEAIAEVTSFYWMSADEVLVGAYGYGLWKVKLKRTQTLSAEMDLGAEAGSVCLSEEKADRCIFVAIDGDEIVSNAPLYDALRENPGGFGAIWLVHHGRVVGADRAGAQLTGVRLSAGASIFSVFPEDVDAETSAARRDWFDELLSPDREGGFSSAPLLAELAEAGPIVGFVMREEELTGVIHGTDELGTMPLPLPITEGEMLDAPALAELPHFFLYTPHLIGATLAAQPDEEVVITLRNFNNVAPVEVLVDGISYAVLDRAPRSQTETGQWVLRSRGPNGEPVYTLPVANLPDREIDRMHGIEVRQTLNGETRKYSDGFLLMHMDEGENDGEDD